MEDSPTDVDSSRDVSEDQSEDSCTNITRSFEENLPSVGEQASENQSLPSPRQAEVSSRFSCEFPTPSLQASNIDQLEKTSTDVYPPHELQSDNNCSRNEDALKTPRQQQQQQQPMASCTSILEDSDASKTKTNQKVLSPFATRRNADFTSPPERGTTVGNRSLSKNLKETNTPSPEKRRVETDVDLTSAKRLRKTPQSGSGKPGMETEYYRSKLGLSKTFYKSLTNLQIQPRKVEIQKNKESESPNPPSTPIKRKSHITRDSSVESKTANDPNSTSPSAAANIVDKSPAYLQMQSEVSARNADEFRTKIKTSLAKHSDLEDMLQTGNSQNFPTKELEFIFSNELNDSPSNIPNIRERHSISDVPDEGANRNLTSKKADTIMHPTTLNDNSFIGPNASGKQEGMLPVSGVSLEVLQPDLLVKETESAVHALSLTDKASSSNRRPASKSKNSKTEGFESCIEVKKIQNSTPVSAKETQSASNVADSSVETQILEPSQSSPLILNRHLPLSCHLPRWRNSSVTDNPRPVLEFNTSDKRVEYYQNRSDSSIRTSTLDREPRFQWKELSALESRGIHRRSLSDVTVTTRNSSEIQALQNQTNSLIGSQSKEMPTSRSLLDISKDANRTTCFVKPLVRRMTPRSTSNTNSATPESSLTGHIEQLWRGATETLSISRSNPELQMQQNPNASQLQSRHPRFFSGDTSRSRNQPEEVSDMGPPHIDVFEGQATTSSYQPIVTAGSFSDQASTSRNQPSSLTGHIEQLWRSATETLSISRSNPELQMQQNPNASQLQSRHPRFFSGDTSRSRNQPEEVSDMGPPHIDVFEGQATTSSYQPIVSDQASTSRNQPEGASNANPRHIDTSQGQASTSRYQSGATGGFSSNDQPETLSDFLNFLSNYSPSGEAGERTRALFRPDEHAAQARILLCSVLRQILLYNGENDLLRRFVPISDLIEEEQNFTEQANQILCLKLTCYLNHRISNFVTSAILNHLMHGLTAETFTEMIYEKLIASVVGTLTFILCVPRTRDFSAFIFFYSNFRSLYDEFSRESSQYNVDNIEDEASRNRVKALQKMINSLMLQTLDAHQKLLMYIGENSDERSIEIYILRLWDEDKRYLRRNIT